MNVTIDDPKGMSGIVNQPSQHSVEETVEKLRGILAIRQRGHADSR